MDANPIDPCLTYISERLLFGILFRLLFFLNLPENVFSLRPGLSAEIFDKRPGCKNIQFSVEFHVNLPYATPENLVFFLNVKTLVSFLTSA